MARSLRLQLTDMSCSSATIASLTAPERTGGGTNPAQSGALSPGTALVTLGIGGNDVGWIEPLIPAAPAAPLHPNAAGERGMADAIVRAVTAAP